MKQSLLESWFSVSRSECLITDETWKTALDFERIWLKKFNIDPDCWNVTGWGSIVLDLETKDGVISLEFGGHQVGFYTDFKEGLKNYAAEGFDWKDNGDLLSEDLKKLLKKYGKSEIQ